MHQNSFRMRWTAAAILLGAAIGAGCASTPMTPAQLEADLQRRLPTVVEDPEFTLRSPYGQAATDAYAEVARREMRVVKTCFGAGAEPARLYLVPVPEGETPSAEEPWRHASRGGYEGGAFESGFAFLWVREGADGALAMLQAELSGSRLRHEMAHLSARREGLTGDTWFNEGLAGHVEHLQDVGGELRPHVFPHSLVVARKANAPGELQALLDWTRSDELSVDHRGVRYAQAEALVRFLLERESSGGFLARAKSIRAMTREDILALEPEWNVWLADQNALEALLAASADPHARRAAGSMLPTLAEAGARELFTAEGDSIAITLLKDPETFVPASTFLAFFRAKALDPVELIGLCDSPKHRERVLGAALRARRGERVDLEAAQAAWDQLLPAGKSSCAALARLIPGLEDR